MTTPRQRIAFGAAALALLAVGCGNSSESPPTTGAASTRRPVETFEVDSNLHVDGPVEYPQSPPVGGPHNGAWQNCGLYLDEVPNETAVHSLEHGAVWITFDPALDTAQATMLAGYANNQTHVLITPFTGLNAPIVASAWGVQQEFDDASDPGIAEFVERYQLGSGAPEPGAPCSSGVGDPA